MQTVATDLSRLERPASRTGPCQRCIEGSPARYRVTTDLMDMLVCEECAELARELGLAVKTDVDCRPGLSKVERLVENLFPNLIFKILRGRPDWPGIRRLGT